MKVAVVGSGVSGLGATWLLNEYSDHEVHLYESDYRPGGHANTVHFSPGGKAQGGVDVDTGFIVFNPSTYPNFLRFLKLYPPPNEGRLRRLSSWVWGKFSFGPEVDTGIRILPTEMTFSVSRDGGAFEWAGKSPATIFCQVHRLLDPQMWRMIYDILRFNACARRVLLTPKNNDEKEMSIGEYLDKEGYSASFRNNYLIPMTAAIWSTPPDKCFADFPARTLIQFLYNHHLLQIIGKPSWLTIQGGSHKYVNAILSRVPQQQLHLSTSVESLRNINEDGRRPQVVLRTENGDEMTYDHVILACHSDTALDILRTGGITDEEDRILGQFSWNRNEVVLHSDADLMPRRRIAWSCWNYLSFTKAVPLRSGEEVEYSSESSDEDLYDEKGRRPRRSTSRAVEQVSLTYGMNDLQHIPEEKYGPVLVTLNPPFEPAEDKIRGRWKYDHPVLDAKAIQAQNEMYKIQNTRSISYAGAYLKYGFHEDGFTSGLLAACSIDDDQESLPSSAPFTAALTGMTIPTRKLTVHPPFEIEHADRHLQLSMRGSENLANALIAQIFDYFETSGARGLIGTVGAIILGIVAWLLGIQDF